MHNSNIRRNKWRKSVLSFNSTQQSSSLKGSILHAYSFIHKFYSCSKIQDRYWKWNKITWKRIRRCLKWKAIKRIELKIWNSLAPQEYSQCFAWGYLASSKCWAWWYARIISRRSISKQSWSFSLGYRKTRLP